MSNETMNPVASPDAQHVEPENDGRIVPLPLADQLELLFKKFDLAPPPEDVTEVILIWKTPKAFQVSGSINDRITARGMIETAPDVLKAHWQQQDLLRFQEMQRIEALKQAITAGQTPRRGV